jgi:hypothetical protein
MGGAEEKDEGCLIRLLCCAVCQREAEMKLEVDCYSGRKADERPVRFRRSGRDYLVEQCWTSVTVHMAPLTRFLQMTAEDPANA